MQIGIIGGTGPEGRGLAARLGQAGIAARVGSRDRSRAVEAVAHIRAGGSTWPIEAATNEEIFESSDLMCLAVPFASAADVIERYRDRFRDGAVLVDLTVPLAFTGGKPALVDLPEGSAAEHLRARLPRAVRLAATLKTVPARVLGRVDEPLDCDEFVCGDSPEARELVMAALGRIPGLRLLDAGGLEAARALERMTLLCVSLNKRYRVHAARFRVVGV